MTKTYSVHVHKNRKHSRARDVYHLNFDNKEFNSCLIVIPSFLHLRTAVHGNNKKISNTKTEEKDYTDRPLPGPTQLSPAAPQIECNTDAVFLDTTALPLDQELKKFQYHDQFSIYNPLFPLAVPGLTNNLRGGSCPDFSRMHADFTFMHFSSFRNERFDWSPSFSTNQPAVNFDVFKGEMLFSPPAKVMIPSEVRQPFRCDQCGKIFKTKYTLAIHLKMPNHTVARPFVCSTCGKGFRLSSTLCRHKIIHTKEKPYKCHVCEKAFNRSSTLKTHVRTHSLEKEFVCDRCGKGFHQKGNLRNHILIHTGEKPYKCTLCQKAFNKLSNLKFHMHVHTDNSPYRCKVCKVSFSRRCDLKSHVENAHSQKESEF